MNLKDYFQKAQKNKFAIGQFNFSTIEQLRAIFSAAQKTRSPVILGTSEGEAGFMGLEEVVALVGIMRKRYRVPAFLNLDHGKNFEIIQKAIGAGYDAVLFDGSELPLKKNLEILKKVVKSARRKGVIVEGEIGHVGQESCVHKGKAAIKKEELTLPDEASYFVRKSGINSLAVAIGNVHGIYKKMPRLDFGRLTEIKKKVKVPLVLHGASGFSKAEIQRAIGLGVVKVNYNTELRLAWKEGFLEAFQKYQDEVKPYKILSEVQRNIEKIVFEKILWLGSRNRI